MNIRILIISVILSLFAIAPLCADVPDIKLHEKCLYPTIGVGYGGSGIIVRSSLVDGKYQNIFITCAHVADYSNVRVFEYKDHSAIKSRTVLPCYFYAIDTKRDLAIGMFISERKMPTAEVNFDSRVFIGNDVFRIGCGLGDEPRLDVGKVSSVSAKVNKHTEILRTTVHTLPGDSGSALFNEYKVIGIMILVRARINSDGSRISFPMMSYAVPVHKFQAWNKENNGAFSFAWDEESAMPRLPFYEIKLMREWEIVGE